MDISQYAKKSKLPLKSLRFMAQKGWIENPLTELDLVALELVENIWMNREILRPQLAKFSYKRRLKLIETADLKTKWERYAYSRLKNMPERKNLRMSDLVGEIELTYGFVLKPAHIKKLYRVKKAVYNRRQR